MEDNCASCASLLADRHIPSHTFATPFMSITISLNTFYPIPSTRLLNFPNVMNMLKPFRDICRKLIH